MYYGIRAPISAEMLSSILACMCAKGPNRWIIEYSKYACSRKWAIESEQGNLLGTRNALRKLLFHHSRNSVWALCNCIDPPDGGACLEVWWSEADAESFGRPRDQDNALPARPIFCWKSDSLREIAGSLDQLIWGEPDAPETIQSVNMEELITLLKWTEASSWGNQV